MSPRSGGSRYCMDGTIDIRFSDPDAGATPWDETAAALARAALYWITIVRADGRPHVTPLIGVWHDGAMHFCTGMREQNGHNLVHNDSVALTTGINTWAEGLDVVVERTAVQVTDKSRRGGASELAREREPRGRDCCPSHMRSSGGALGLQTR